MTFHNFIAKGKRSKIPRSPDSILLPSLCSRGSISCLAVGYYLSKQILVYVA